MAQCSSLQSCRPAHALSHTGRALCPWWTAPGMVTFRWLNPESQVIPMREPLYQTCLRIRMSLWNCTQNCTLAEKNPPYFITFIWLIPHDSITLVSIIQHSQPQVFTDLWSFPDEEGLLYQEYSKEFITALSSNPGRGLEVSRDVIPLRGICLIRGATMGDD